MNFREYCMNLHGLTDEQMLVLPYFGAFVLEHVDISELIDLSAITGMSVSEHADELETLIKQGNEKAN